MRISFFKGGLRALLLAALCLVGCTKTNPTLSECYIVIDKTGSFTNPVNGESTTHFLIKSLGVDLTEVFEMGITTYVIPLSNLRNNGEERVELPAGDGLMNIETKRIEAQTQFQKDCVQAIKTVDQGTYDQSGSQILVPLMRKLKMLCNSKADNKIFVIMSDLVEHSTSVSFYNAKDDIIRAALDKALDTYAPDLSGVRVINVYKPSDVSQDALFDRVRTIWKDALTDRGATFTYRPNL